MRKITQLGNGVNAYIKDQQSLCSQCNVYTHQDYV